MRRNLIQEWPSVGAIARWLIGGSGCCLLAITLSHPSAVASSETAVNNAQNVTQVKPSATVNRPTLNLGSKGVEVSELQATLKLLGYYTDAVNGLYGQSSAIAVSKFQKAAGLQADGIVGPETWRRLFPAAPPAQANSPSPSNSSGVASSVASNASKPTTSETASTDPKPANSPSPSNSSGVASSVASNASKPTTSATTSTSPKPETSPSPSNRSGVASSAASTTSSSTSKPATSRTTSTRPKPANSPSPSNRSGVASSVASTATKPATSRTTSTRPKPANSPPKSIDLPILQLGMKGPAIARLQERLRTLGFFKGAVDSVFGLQTQAAVQAAQRNFKLNPDGIVGSTTWRYLLR